MKYNVDLLSTQLHTATKCLGQPGQICYIGFFLDLDPDHSLCPTLSQIHYLQYVVGSGTRG